MVQYDVSGFEGVNCFVEALYDKLNRYMQEGCIPFHMPGHKRNPEKFGMGNELYRDITEINGFDDYHYPQGIIKEIQEKASGIYGTKASFYLVNGSSCGILTAISAAVHQDMQIIVARNSHKSVYNGISVNQLMPYYIYPDVSEYGIMGEIDARQVEEALRVTGAHVVLITSPTYEGIVSDISKIAEICHENDAVLIVDEAHGAHFAFHQDFPKTAMECGADIVIESLHKTLPCYTQTAILHVCGERINLRKIKHFLSVYQTSSPSYLFMSGINQCIDYMVSEIGKKENQIYLGELYNLRDNLNKLKNIKLFSASNYKCFDYDVSKLVLCCEGKGAYLYDKLLKQYHIQMEMAADDYVIAMTSVGDKPEWYDVLYNALVKIDKELSEQNGFNNIKITHKYDIIKPDVKIKPYTAFMADAEFVDRKKSAGRIAQEILYAYPPGIPLVYPGELLTEEVLSQIERKQKAGIEIKGFADGVGDNILCIR